MRPFVRAVLAAVAVLPWAAASAQADTILAGERLTPSRPGAVTASAAAPATASGGALRLQPRGRAARSVLTTKAVREIVVRAHRRGCATRVTMQVTVGGRIVLRRAVNRTRPTRYTAAVTLPAGRHTVRVSVLRAATARCTLVVDAVRLVDADPAPSAPASPAPAAGSTPARTPSTPKPPSIGAPSSPSPASPVTAGGTPAPLTGLPTGYQLVWQEEFDGALDRLPFFRYAGPGSNGAGTRRPENTSTGGGELRIAGIGSTVGGVASWSDWVYGIFEIRAKTDPGQAYSNAWMLWPADDQWPMSTEIDISEHPNGSRTNSRTTVHWGSDHRTDHRTNATTTYADFTQWHTWTVVWTPTSLLFHLDGRHYMTQTAGVPSTPHRWALQLDVGPVTNWLSAPAPGASTTARVDYVRTWQLR